MPRKPKGKTPQIRDRIKELRRVSASMLRANPKNWRTHPPAQVSAMQAVLAEIGFADAMLARETEDGLELIDGHLRQEIMGDQLVPVLIVDVTAEEADKMLLTLDPLAAMAGRDSGALIELLADVTLQEQALLDMLGNLGMTPAVDPEDEWQGMPEFTRNDVTSWNHVIVHFENKADMARFAKLVGQSLSEKRVSIWYPEKPYLPARNRYVSE